MEERIFTADEIEVFLKESIEKDKQLKGFFERMYLHTVAHEMGHLRTAMERNFTFSYIRVYRYICYIDKGKNPQLQKKRLTCWEYIQIHKPYGIKDVLKSGPNGQCVVFISDPTILTVEDDYIAVLNAGPKATAKFKEYLKNKIGCLEMKLFDFVCYRANPVCDALDGSPEKQYYKSRASENYVGSDQNSIEKIRKDQNSIEKISEDQKFLNKLNSRFKDVHLYMTGEKESLLKKDYGSMLAVAKVIRKNYLEVRE